MRKYGKWWLTLSLLAATPGMTFAAGSKSSAGDAPAQASASAKVENQKMAEEIAKALKKAKLKGTGVQIEFRNGVATIKGSVTDPAERAKATDVIGRVPGVSRVDNQIVMAGQAAGNPVAGRRPGVVPADHRAAGERQLIQQVNHEIPGAINNQQVAEQIAAALTSAQLDGYDIEIRYQNGTCMLDGSVPTMAQKAAASRVCQQVPGVQQVANRLACSEEAAPGARNPYAPVAYQNGVPGAEGSGGAGMAPAGPGAPVPGATLAPGAVIPGGPGAYAGGAPFPPAYGNAGGGTPQAIYNQPSVPDYAWPSYAQYPNYAAVTYPQQYSASAFPYIGPFYPYPQVPLGWRKASLEWDDGYWNLKFRSRTDKWWWFVNPNNW